MPRSLPLPLLLLVLAGVPAAHGAWRCSNTTTTDIGRLPGVVVWTSTTCEGRADGSPFHVGPLRFNIVAVDLASPTVRLTPLLAAANESFLQTLDAMAAQRPGVIAGINGGYFWRLDSSSFKDYVCRGKTRADAEHNSTGTCAGAAANYGVSDGLVKINGTVLGCNCDLPGYSVPAVYVINGSGSRIEKLPRGGAVDESVRDAIAAGPNLVTDGKIDIDPHDDNINIPEHAANTAVGLRVDAASNTAHAYLVTADGQDGKSVLDPLSGINAHQLADFLVDQLKVTSAMGMDQGGSTTMYVRGHGVNGIVSCSDTSDPSAPPRRVFDGLFVELV